MWKRLSGPHRKELSIASPALSRSNPVSTFRFTSALPSPSVSLRYHRSGTTPTNTPPSQHATATGESSSAYTVALPYCPSPSASSRSLTHPRTFGGFGLAYWLYSGNSAT